MRLISSFKKLKWSDFLFGLFVVLLIVPQTRQSIQVAVNKVKLLVWSPGIADREDADHVFAFDYHVTDFKGQKVTHRIGEDKITFLSFWATWCPPCVAEISTIEALYQDYGDAVNFVLISQEKPEVVQSFLQKRNLQLPAYLPISPVPEILQSKSLPTNFLIDGEGNIIIKETGAANWNSKKVRKFLDGLLQNEENR